MVADAEQFMHQVVEKAPNAGGPHAGSLGLEAKHLTDKATFPIEAWVVCRPAQLESRIERGQHADRKGTICGDLLFTADRIGGVLRVTPQQALEGQILWASLQRLPAKATVDG